MIIFLEYVLILLEAISVSIIINLSLRILLKQKDINSFKKILCFACLIFIVFLISSLITHFLPKLMILKPLLFISFSIIFTKIVYKTPFMINFYSTSFYLTLSALLNLFFAFFMKSIYISPNIILENNNYKILMLLLIIIFEILISFFIYFFIKILKNTFCIKNDIKKYILPQVIALIFCMLPTMCILIFNYFEFANIFILINFFQIFILSFISLYNYKNAISYQKTEIELNKVNNYNNTLSKLNEEVKILKHDMSNIIQCILSYASCNDISGLKSYCNSLSLEFEDIQTLSMLSPNIINEPSIYGTLASKILIAKKKNLKIDLNVNIDFKTINLNVFDLSKIIGIFLDNAIHAAEDSLKKEIKIEFHQLLNEVNILIINSINEKDSNINLKNIFKYKYSKKKTGSGIGLYEIVNILKKNKQLDLFTNIDKKTLIFTQNLIIKN